MSEFAIVIICTEFDTNSKFLTTNNTNQAIPAFGTSSSGGVGDKLILTAGTGTTYPNSIGNESAAIWISSSNITKFYNKTTMTEQVLFYKIRLKGKIYIRSKLR
jgi:hypothetical protein